MRAADRVIPIHADANELPYADEYFDAIVSIDAYHYFGTGKVYCWLLLWCKGEGQTCKRHPFFSLFWTGLDSGVHFTRILMSTAWLIGAFAICQNTLQAVGAATPALLASIFRQGIIFIPAVFIMKAIIGVDGLIWAQPVADVLSLVIVIFMLRRKIGKMP